MKKLLSLILVLTLCTALLIGCGAHPQNAAAHQHSHAAQSIEIIPEAVQLAEQTPITGGVLCLKINPEIALHYDEKGNVTKLEGRNADGVQLLQTFTGYEGKEATQVLSELVNLIGKAGYFVEEADGQARKIVLELDPGSQVPHEKFLEDMAKHVKSCVENQNWVGEREFEYPQVPQTTEPTPITAPAAPAETKPAATAASATVPAGLCPVCADDDCDDGKYCDDADEKAENLREYEAEQAAKKATAQKTPAKKTTKQATKCSVCGDTDCDDGKYCDDWDDRDDHDDDHDDDDDDD